MLLKTARCIASLVVLGAMATTAIAQPAYPDKPITLVVPYSAGGPTDTVARVVGQAMSERLGQQILVQNVGGAGGTLGSGQVAAAAPDGYTLLIHHIGLASAPTMYPNLNFDPIADFAPVGLVTDAPMAVIARKDFAANTMGELVEAIKADGETMTLAHGGNGGAAHLCGMLLQEATGVQMVTVPYQGTAPAMTDILGGQVDLMCDQTTNTVAQIKNGDVKAYAVTSAERVSSMPDVPTTAEAGLPELQVGVWHGLYGPAGMDPQIVETLDAALKEALADETVIQRLADIGTTPAAQEEATPDALKEKLASQIELWRPLIQKAGVYAQ